MFCEAGEFLQSEYSAACFFCSAVDVTSLCVTRPNTTLPRNIIPSEAWHTAIVSGYFDSELQGWVIACFRTSRILLPTVTEPRSRLLFNDRNCTLS
jgi:hypothetical protein